MNALSVEFFLVPPKPIPGQVPAFDATGQPATWPASTATLIRGERESLLVDTLITTGEARELVSWIRDRGTDLRTVYITHPHGDHLYGLGTILAGFPNARAITRADIAPFMAGQVTPEFTAVWSGFFPGQIDASVPLPEAFAGEEFRLEGRPIRFVNVGGSDTVASSVVHVPDVETVVSGDVAYNNVHLWLWGSTSESRRAWMQALDLLEKLQPRTIVAGHRDPAAPDDDADRILDETRQYLGDFDAAASSAGSADELIETMVGRHGKRANPYTLWVAAYDVIGRRDAR
jgi:glyoxylase-like metal-dependent hydrolase (beta-lactamase superfamily II)